jgi:ECF sigma factor
MQGDADITGLLLAWRAGDAGAVDRLLPLIYDDVRRIARRQLNREQSGHTLDSTALVHEALSDAVFALEERADTFLAIASSSATFRSSS